MTKRSRSQAKLPCVTKVKPYLSVQSTAIFHNLACAERFFDAFFVVVSMKGGQSKLGRLEKLRIKNFCWSPHGRIKSRHVVTSDYCFARFQKWKCSGLINFSVFCSLSPKLYIILYYITLYYITLSKWKRWKWCLPCSVVKSDEYSAHARAVALWFNPYYRSCSLRLWSDNVKPFVGK